MNTPKQQKQALKERLHSVLLRLPAYFLNTFLFVYPEYKDQRKHVYNVMCARSLDEQVIERFEKFANLLEANQHNPSNS